MHDSPFIPWRDHPDDMFRCPYKGTMKARGQMKWYVRRVSIIHDDQHRIDLEMKKSAHLRTANYTAPYYLGRDELDFSSERIWILPIL